MRSRTPAGIASAIALAAAAVAFAPQAHAATADAAASAPLCSASQLSVALEGGDAGAGQIYTYLVVTNHGSSACQVTGYPGLSMLDAKGNEIGVPATRESLTYNAVVLAPGASASDTVHTVNRQTNDPGECLPTSTDLRMYPPGSKAAITFPGKVTNCDHTFSVTPFGPGDTGNPSNGPQPTDTPSATPSRGSSGGNGGGGQSGTPTPAPTSSPTSEISAVPSGAPDTGLASTSSGGGDTGLIVAGAAGLLVLGGAGAAARRRSQRSRARG